MHCLAPFPLAALLLAHSAQAQVAAPPVDGLAVVRAVDGAWWQAFGDPALTAVIERALVGSPTIEAAGARLDQARAAARTTRASLLPSLSASGSAAALRQSLDDPQIRPFAGAPGFLRDIERYELGLRASWEIDLFGAKPRLRSARARAVGADADLAAARVAVVADVASTYFSIIELRERVAIGRARVASLERQSTALRMRVAQGVVAPLEQDRFEGEAGAARAAVPLLEIALAGEQARLGVLAGIDSAAEIAAFVPATSRLPAFAQTEAPKGLAFSVANRPDVVAAAARAAASEADVSTARSQRYPRLSLGGLLATIVAGPASLFTSRSVAGQGFAGLSLNLFDFGRIDAEIAAASGRRREALAEYRATVLRAASEQRVAADTLALRQAEARERAGAAMMLGRAARTAAATYDAGALDLTTLLDTDRASLAAAEAVAVSQSESARSLVALVRVSAGSAATRDQAAVAATN